MWKEGHANGKGWNAKYYKVFFFSALPFSGLQDAENRIQQKTTDPREMLHVTPHNTTPTLRGTWWLVVIQIPANLKTENVYPLRDQGCDGSPLNYHPHCDVFSRPKTFQVTLLQGLLRFLSPRRSHPNCYLCCCWRSIPCTGGGACMHDAVRRCRHASISAARGDTDVSRQVGTQSGMISHNT